LPRTGNDEEEDCFVNGEHWGFSLKCTWLGVPYQVDFLVIGQDQGAGSIILLLEVHAANVSLAEALFQ